MTADRSTVHLAVIGLGRIGELHARNIASLVPRARLTAVCDVDDHRAGQIGDELQCFVGSVEDVLARKDVDAVVIATPIDSHLELVRQAVAAEKHILCEKPLAPTVEEAIQAVECLPGHLVFQMGFHRRFDPDYAEAARLLHSGQLGQMYLLRTSMRDMAPPSDDIVRAQVGGFIVDASGHDFDAARWLGGEIAEIWGAGAALSSELFKELGDYDNILLMLRFASGALGVIDNSRVAGYGFECSTEVLASLGTTRIDNHHRHQIALLRDGHEGFARVRDFRERFELAYRVEIDAFCEAILLSAPPRVTAEDGVAAVVLSRAAMKAVESGQSVSLYDDPWYRAILARQSDVAMPCA